MDLLTNEQKIKVLIDARNYYLDTTCNGMCACIKHSIEKAFYCQVNNIQNYIVDFNHQIAVEKFESKASCKCGYWWKLSDKEHRLAYFDYLIDLYK